VQLEMKNLQVCWAAATGRLIIMAYLVDGGQTVENAEHELRVACLVIRHLNTQGIHQHLIQRTGTQGVRQLAKVVF